MSVTSKVFYSDPSAVLVLFRRQYYFLHDIAYFFSSREEEAYRKALDSCCESAFEAKNDVSLDDYDSAREKVLNVAKGAEIPDVGEVVEEWFDSLSVADQEEITYEALAKINRDPALCGGGSGKKLYKIIEGDNYEFLVPEYGRIIRKRDVSDKKLLAELFDELKEKVYLWAAVEGELEKPFNLEDEALVLAALEFLDDNNLTIVEDDKAAQEVYVLDVSF